MSALRPSREDWNVRLAALSTLSRLAVQRFGFSRAAVFSGSFVNIQALQLQFLRPQKKVSEPKPKAEALMYKSRHGVLSMPCNCRLLNLKGFSSATLQGIPSLETHAWVVTWQVGAVAAQSLQPGLGRVSGLERLGDSGGD